MPWTWQLCPDVEAIRSILGAEAFNARADALVGRITTNIARLPNSRLREQDGAGRRRIVRYTVCAKCGNLVKLGTDSWCAQSSYKRGSLLQDVYPPYLQERPILQQIMSRHPQRQPPLEAPATSAGSGSRADDPIALSDDGSASSDDDETPLRQRMTKNKRDGAHHCRCG